MIRYWVFFEGKRNFLVISTKFSRRSLDLAAKVFSILPQVNGISFARDLLQIIGHYSESFLKERTQAHLLKIAKAKWELNQSLENSLQSERNVYFKLFAVKFTAESEDRKILGIMFAMNFLSEHEQFKKSHLLNTLRKLVPGTSILEDSFFMLVDEKNSRLFCYCEIEKFRGTHLGLEESLRLKKLLAQEIKDNIEICSPELWIPENNEQTLKDVLRLHQEVSDINDIPHVSISFKEQSSSSIRFVVIIIRVVREGGPFLREKIFNFWSDVEIELEKVDPFLDGHVKETLVLSLEMLSSLFYRKNYAIDLLKARQYICMTLEQIMGEFRDYNGGLLSKQTEQFNSLINKISTQVDYLSDFESLFYSLAPSNIQLLIPVEKAIEISKAFYQLKEENSKKPFTLQFKKSNRVFFIIIKTRSTIFDSVFSEIDKSSLIAKSSKKIEQNTYHFLVQINPLDFSMLQSIQERLSILEKQAKQLFLKEVRISFQEGSPTSFHPHLNGDVKTFTVCKALYDGLVRMDPKGKIQLSVAESIQISSCKKKYTFTIRDSKWSNGAKVTSYDFARAWKKAIFSRKNGRNPTGSRHVLLIKNAEEIIQGKLSLSKLGVHTPDSHTIILELANPHPFFLNLLATITFSPLYGEDLDQEPTIFNGPFIPVIYSSEKIELHKNKYYWDAKEVALEKIIISFYKDPDETYQLFKQEKLDWIGSPFNSMPEKKLKDIQTYPTNYPFWFFCNTHHPKLNSLKIRRALYLSIDREKLVETVLPSQKPLYGVVPDTLSTMSAKKLFPENPIEKAQALFEEGLREIGYTKENFTLTMNHSDIPNHRKIVCFTKECWEKALGIQIKLFEVPWNGYIRNLFNTEFEIGGLDFITRYEDVSAFLNIFYSSQNNYSKWKNDEYKAVLLKRGFSEDSLKYAEKILMEELPAIPVSNQTDACFMGSLKNFVFPRFGYADFKWVKK